MEKETLKSPKTKLSKDNPHFIDLMDSMENSTGEASEINYPKTISLKSD